MHNPHGTPWERLPGAPPDEEGWRVCDPGGFGEAEALLDLLERLGVSEREILFVEGQPAVRWRAPPPG